MKVCRQILKLFNKFISINYHRKYKYIGYPNNSEKCLLFMQQSKLTKVSRTTTQVITRYFGRWPQTIIFSELSKALGFDETFPSRNEKWIEQSKPFTDKYLPNCVKKLMFVQILPFSSCFYFTYFPLGFSVSQNTFNESQWHVKMRIHFLLLFIFCEIFHKMIVFEQKEFCFHLENM